jgi:putative two-component system response regulator
MTHIAMTSGSTTTQILGEPNRSRTMSIPSGRILIVDDESVNVKIVRKYLRDVGFNDIISTTESSDVFDLMDEAKPDVLLLDLVMPILGGMEILEGIRSDEQWSRLQVVILTASTDRETKVQALQLGANDFLGKPVDSSELIVRVRNALLLKAHFDQMDNYSRRLEEEVAARTAELSASREEVIYRLAKAAEFRDDDTGRHVIRVGRFAEAIALKLGWSIDAANLLRQAAQLHDVGKIGVPDSVLLKPGKLTPDEFELIQKHCGFGKKIVEPVRDAEWQTIQRHTFIGSSLLGVSSSPVLEMAERIALTHHEKWNGKGYPLGLTGADIPIEGRIVAIADVFDALSTKRSYKPAFPSDQCFDIMQSERGEHFDPEVLDAFLAIRHEIIQIRIESADTE